MEDKKRMRKSKTRTDNNESSSSSKKQKEKTRQRGLGVATLERLRTQENLKQIAQEHIKQMVHQIPNFPLNLYQNQQQGLMMNNNNNVVVPGIPFPPSFSSFEGINNNNNNKVGQFCGDQGFFAQRVGGLNGIFPGKNCVGGLVGFSGVGLGNSTNMKKNEAFNEISSTPSSLWGLSEKCGFCHNKKKVDNKFPNQSQQVEVVAVHRKGGPCGGGVMMEYEFFPEKGGRNSSSVAVAAAAEELIMSGRASGGGGGGVESSSSIDLSLKLYY